MASIEIRDVRKSYGAAPVIRGVDVDIADGEFVTLVGPSGCGKSTLLRMIAGLETISGGEIRIAGRTVNELPPKERDIAMVFQSYALYPHMTVAENMGFSLRLRKASKQEFETSIKRAASILSLEKLLDRYPKQLSGGQRQRVAMGRAIVRDPAVFLFDEPLSNLDAKLRVQMRAEIRDLHQKMKTTTVYVTHDQIEAMTMADRIVVMHDGIVEQAGPPLELYDRPANIFVAGFLGSPAMNFLAGTVEPDGASLRLEDGAIVPLPARVEPKAAMTLGIRPEHIGLEASGLPAVVRVLEPTGSETHLVAQLSGQEVTAVVKERYIAEPGTRIGVKFDRDHIHLFDDSGKRVDTSQTLNKGTAS
jgi:multiple sugar transport system ATP-binding protein